MKLFESLKKISKTIPEKIKLPCSALLFRRPDLPEGITTLIEAVQWEFTTCLVCCCLAGQSTGDFPRYSPYTLQ